MTAPVAPIVPGIAVTVRGGPPEAHCRTPHYLRGRPGVVVQEVGTFRDPTLLAYHKPGLPMRTLFRVRFLLADLWPGYGPEPDSLYADLYDSWLVPGHPGAPGEASSHA